MYGISINTQQNQKIDNAGGGSLRAGVGSPRVAAGSPRVAGGSPRAVGSPRVFGSPRAKGSPKTVEVGEIDTRAPFQSVKAAVSLFGEAGASPRSSFAARKNKSADERAEKENQLHLALNELDAYKNQLRNSEATKAQALRDLDKARKTLQDLAAQLGTINKSEKQPVHATEAATSDTTNARKCNVESEREQYVASAAELNAVKQQLAQLRQDFDAAMEAKTAAIDKASKAQNAAVVNRERVLELSREVAKSREALAKLACVHAQEDHAKLVAAKQASLKSLVMAKEEVEVKMRAINDEFDPELTEHLKAKLDETNKEIEVLREQLTNAKSADLNAWKTAASELETAKKAMQEVVALENSLRSQVDSLQLELDNADKNQPKLMKNNPSCSKDEPKHTMAGPEHVQGPNMPREDTKDYSDEYIASKILQLTSEAEIAIREAEEMKKCAELLRKEAETARIVAKEAEEKLESVLKEARSSSTDNNNNTIRYSSISKLNGKIKLPKAEYESLKKKTEATTKKAAESKSKRMGITSCHSGCF